MRDLDKTVSLVETGLLKEHSVIGFIKISAIHANFHFPQYKSMEAFSCHSNLGISKQGTSLTAIKQYFLLRLMLLTILQSFSFIRLSACEELIFNIFRKFSLSDAMAANQTQRFRQI